MVPISPVGWRKSSYSGSNGGQCVEVAIAAGMVRIRDSKYSGPPERRPIITVPIHRWVDVLEFVLRGGAGQVGMGLSIELCAEGGTTLKSHDGTELAFTAAEWDAFAKGIVNDEFSAS
ncbi:DUF397 domain-containing protein [Nocardia tengchongensis]|uniref:DUF397 domain-containing protein n=1 Tax=Nocardia tengchongensis TaxID=2055889 RepID=UPI003678E7A2